MSEEACIRCPPGTYQSGQAMTAESGCVECWPGTYSAEVGANTSLACLLCTAGTYSQLVGLSSVADCTYCGLGVFSTTLGANSTKTCQVCRPGKFQTTTGVETEKGCLPCAAGTFSNVYGANSSDVCVPCSAGEYQSALGLTGGDGSCTLCAVGTYSTASAAISSASCLACPAGKYQPTSGKTALSDCIACASGRYSLLIGSTAASDCLPVTSGGEIVIQMQLAYDEESFDVSRKIVVVVAVAEAVGVDLSAVTVAYIAGRRRLMEWFLLSRQMGKDSSREQLSSWLPEDGSLHGKDSIRAAVPSVTMPSEQQNPNIRVTVTVPRALWIQAVAIVSNVTFEHSLNSNLISLGMSAITGAFSVIALPMPMQPTSTTTPAVTNTTPSPPATPQPFPGARVDFSVDLPLSLLVFRMQQQQYILAVANTLEINPIDVTVVAVYVVNSTLRRVAIAEATSIIVNTQVQMRSPAAAQIALSWLTLTALGANLEERGLPLPTGWFISPALGNLSSAAPTPSVQSAASSPDVAPMAGAVAGAFGAVVVLFLAALIGWSFWKARGTIALEKGSSEQFAVEAELGFVSGNQRISQASASNWRWWSLGLGAGKRVLQPIQHTQQQASDFGTQQLGEVAGSATNVFDDSAQYGQRRRRSSAAYVDSAYGLSGEVRARHLLSIRVASDAGRNSRQGTGDTDADAPEEVLQAHSSSIIPIRQIGSLNQHVGVTDSKIPLDNIWSDAVGDWNSTAIPGSNEQIGNPQTSKPDHDDVRVHQNVVSAQGFEAEHRRHKQQTRLRSESPAPSHKTFRTLSTAGSDNGITT